MSQEPMVTQHDIAAGLRQLGLDRGAVVEVHSSLSAFGRVAGGAPAVINALIDVVGPHGTIVMSAYPISPAIPLTDEEKARGITWKVKRLVEDSPEKTGMGTIVEVFRQRPDVVCGAGLFRTCAWGKNAERHCNGYNYLLELDGWTLLLGAGIDRCSSMHAAERIPLPDQIAAYFRIPDDIQRDYDPDTWNIGYGGTPDDAWMKVYREADRRGLIRHHQIGRAMCHLFKARAVVNIYEDWRLTDPWGLYGISNHQ